MIFLQTMLILITEKDTFAVVAALRVSSTSPPSSSSNAKMTMGNLKFEVFDNINDISTQDWDRCASTNVFTKHAWLRCLEDSKCASVARGWLPQHIAVYRNADNNSSTDGEKIVNNLGESNKEVRDRSIAYVPMYLKTHSQGEFIFDNAFANAAHQAGIEYYPKLLIGVPFTPATGARILLDPDIVASADEVSTIRKEIGEYLRLVALDQGISSIHFNFITNDEANDLACDIETMVAGAGVKYSIRSMFQDLQSTFFPNQQQQQLQSDGFIRRSSIQYHWENKKQAANVTDGVIAEQYENFEDYLACFKSKKRINIRRERRKIYEDEQIRVDVIQGKDILKYEGLVERMFEIYLSTIEKMYWGRQYLTVEFFQMLADSDFIEYLCFICARDRDCGEDFDADDVFAGTFNVIGDGVFYGRYWGCLEEVNNLHFEVCYWKAIEHCIDSGIAKMEPGAGGGDYKFARGFDAALMHSAHYFCHPGLRSAARQYIEMEMEENVEMTEYLKATSKVGHVETKKS